MVSWREDRRRIRRRRVTSAPRILQDERPLYWKAVTYRYRPEVLEALARHGIVPGETTAPPLIRDQLNDLYRFEIRRLKQQLLGGQFPKERYLDLVVELRKHYWLLSIPTDRWCRENP